MESPRLEEVLDNPPAVQYIWVNGELESQRRIIRQESADRISSCGLSFPAWGREWRGGKLTGRWGRAVVEVAEQLPAKRLRVVLGGMEGKMSFQDEVRRRLSSACACYGITSSDEETPAARVEIVGPLLAPAEL